MLGLVAATVFLLTGCTATEAAVNDGMGQHSPAGTSKSARPSEAARMVCSAEIRDTISRVTGLRSPVGKSSWANQALSCRYQLPIGQLVLAVQDSRTLADGRAYFAALRRDTPRTQPLEGLTAFGLPSFATTDGTVAFLKDGKTLRVDASALPRHVQGKSRTGVAYAIAAAVVACWSE